MGGMGLVPIQRSISESISCRSAHPGSARAAGESAVTATPLARARRSCSRKLGTRCSIWLQRAGSHSGCSPMSMESSRCPRSVPRWRRTARAGVVAALFARTPPATATSRRRRPPARLAATQARPVSTYATQASSPANQYETRLEDLKRGRVPAEPPQHAEHAASLGVHWLRAPRAAAGGSHQAPRASSPPRPLAPLGLQIDRLPRPGGLLDQPAMCLPLERANWVIVG